MVDTARRLADTANLLPNNSSGNISAQDVRDLMQGAHAEALGLFNVKTFGAQGDGVTDDRPYIQAAIDQMSNPSGGLGGGTILFPPGEYLIGSALNVHQASIRFIGAGVSPPPGYSNDKQWGTTLKWNGAGGGDMFFITDSGHCDWKNMRLEGNSTPGKRPRALLHFYRDYGLHQTGANGGGWNIDGVEFGATQFSSETTNLGDGAGVWVGETDYGILGTNVNGPDADNDGFLIQNCTFNGYANTAIYLPSIQSVNTLFRTSRFYQRSTWAGYQSATGLFTHSMYHGYHLSMDGNGVDLSIDAGRVSIHGFRSKNSKMIADMNVNASLTIRGGEIDLSAVDPGPYIYNANHGGAPSWDTVSLEDVWFPATGQTSKTINLNGGGSYGCYLNRNAGPTGDAYDPPSMVDMSTGPRAAQVVDKDYNFYEISTFNKIVVS